jgi:hypothetical protein
MRAAICPVPHTGGRLNLALAGSVVTWSTQVSGSKGGGLITTTTEANPASAE